MQYTLELTAAQKKTLSKKSPVPKAPLSIRQHVLEILRQSNKPLSYKEIYYILVNNKIRTRNNTRPKMASAATAIHELKVQGKVKSPEFKKWAAVK